MTTMKMIMTTMKMIMTTMKMIMTTTKMITITITIMMKMTMITTMTMTMTMTMNTKRPASLPGELSPIVAEKEAATTKTMRTTDLLKPNLEPSYAPIAWQ